MILRTTAVPTAFDAVIDALVCTLPFTSFSDLAHLVPVLGLPIVLYHLRAAVSAVRTSGAAPLPVRVPIAVSDSPSSGSGSILRPMLYVPADSGDSSGWLLTVDRWEEQ